MPRPLLLLLLLPLAACDLAPARSELYPSEALTQWHTNSITHDRYHPWQYQTYGNGGGGR